MLAGASGRDGRPTSWPPPTGFDTLYGRAGRGRPAGGHLRARALHAQRHRRLPGVLRVRRLGVDGGGGRRGHRCAGAARPPSTSRWWPAWPRCRRSPSTPVRTAGPGPSTPTRHGRRPLDQGHHHQLGPVRGYRRDRSGRAEAPRHRLFEQAATQGQTVLAAAGDAGSSDCYDPPHGDRQPALSVDDPADQPDVTGVGGTSLTGAVSTPSTETVWNGGAGLGAGGGGNSVDFAALLLPADPRRPDAHRRPLFATSRVGDQQCREVPDVSASSDPDHGDVIFFDGDWRLIRGHQRGSAVVGRPHRRCPTRDAPPPAGFLNPRLYAAGAGTVAAVQRHHRGQQRSVRSAARRPDYPATAHYDLASGWGSPRAAGCAGPVLRIERRLPVGHRAQVPDSGPATGGHARWSSTASGSGPASPWSASVASGSPVVGHTRPPRSPWSPPMSDRLPPLPVTVTTTGTAAGTSAAVPASAATPSCRPGSVGGARQGTRPRAGGRSR